jgi:hypothetical protein
MNDLDGYGIYRKPIPEPKLKKLSKKIKHSQKDVRAVVVDGEVYLNARDICINLQSTSETFSSLSVRNFIRTFIVNLIRRA